MGVATGVIVGNLHRRRFRTDCREGEEWPNNSESGSNNPFVQAELWIGAQHFGGDLGWHNTLALVTSPSVALDAFHLQHYIHLR